MPTVEAQLTDQELQALVDLANQRGVDANTVLKQAISTEKLIADNVKPGDDLLIRKGDNLFSKVIFSK